MVPLGMAKLDIFLENGSRPLVHSNANLLDFRYHKCPNQSSFHGFSEIFIRNRSTATICSFMVHLSRPLSHSNAIARDGRSKMAFARHVLRGNQGAVYKRLSAPGFHVRRDARRPSSATDRVAMSQRTQ